MKELNHVLFGGATANSQYEGGFGIGGKGMDTQDCRKYVPRTSNATTTTRLLVQSQIDEAKIATDNNEYPFRIGTKGYEHWEEDLDLLEELDLDVYRLSISWSRLFPNGDEIEVNKEGVAYYDKVIKGLHARGIKIFLTMNHFCYPLHLIEEYGGWKNRKMIDFYLHYAKTVFELWGDYIDFYLPINEINAGYFSPFNGLGMIRQKDEPYDKSEIFQSLHHQFVASAKTIELGHKMTKAKFGCMAACFCYYPYSCSPQDNLKCLQDEEYYQWFYFDVLAGGYYPTYMNRFFKENDIHFDILEEDLQVLKDNTCDFVSFSYYQSCVVTTLEKEQTAGNLVVTTKNPYLKANEWGWTIDPIGLRITLNKLNDRYHKPVMVSENGLGHRDELVNGEVHDDYRIEYLKNHFEQIKEAINDGVDVRGYFMWGIIDIVSAGSIEMEKRYGVVYVDANNKCEGDFKRIRKDSFYWYQKFLKEHKGENK